MKKSIFILLMLFGISLQAQQETARITIYSNPKNIQIRLNSLLIGTTPLEKFPIQPGHYTLEAISNEAGIWNASNITEDIYITAGQDTTIFIQFPNMVKINSVPFHAKLLQQNNFLGFTPANVDFESYRGKTLTLEKAGYKSQTFVLKTVDSRLFTLEPLDISSGEENGSFSYSLFHSRLKTKFVFLTGTVVTHWLAFYLKNVADDNFDKYNHTGNPALMKKYWDNTQKYDRWSDITLGLSYALLGGLIYTVIH